MSPFLVLAVLVSSGLAALMRYGVSLFFAARVGESWLRRFPWAVLVVNAVGSAVAGIAAGLASIGAMSPEWRLVVITGIAGGLTTFSTFSVETISLLLARRWLTALSSFALNLVIGTTFAFAGYVLVR